MPIKNNGTTLAKPEWETVRAYFGLDDSFCWTDRHVADYTRQYLASVETKASASELGRLSGICAELETDKQNLVLQRDETRASLNRAYTLIDRLLPYAALYGEQHGDADDIDDCLSAIEAASAALPQR